MSQLYVDNIKGRTGGAIGAPSGIVVTGVGTFSGDVSIGGTLTYEDVTNVDSVGLITARSGIFIARDSAFPNDGIIVKGSGSGLGIGTDGPDAALDVRAGSAPYATNGLCGQFVNETSSGPGACSVRLRKMDTTGTIVSGDGVGTIQFSSGVDGDTAFYEYASLETKVVTGTAGSEDGEFNIKTATGGSSTTKLSIDDTTCTFSAGLVEKFEKAGTTLGSQTNNPIADGNVILFTGNESGNLTINFTGVHAKLADGETCSFTVILSPNGSGVINVVQVDGQAITVKWSGGSAPSAGASGQDVYTFQILKTGTGTSDYTVLGAATNYA